MSEVRHRESRHDDIVQRGIEVFGPSVDVLVRELSRRLPLDRRAALLDLVESWPADAEGRPRDTDLLFARLVELLESLEPVPRERDRDRDRDRERGRRRRHRRRRGNAGLGGLIGLAIGAMIGLPIGFLTYLVILETMLPVALRSSDVIMWVVILSVCIPAAALGVAQGGRPTRAGHALVVGLVAFLLGALSLATLGGVGALLYARMQAPPPVAPGREAPAEAIGVELAFGLVPFVALLGGAALAFVMGRRAWLRWTSWSELRTR